MVEHKNSEKELAEILNSIRDMIDKDKKFFAAQRLAGSRNQKSGREAIELTAMIDENGKVVELPLLKKRDGLEARMEKPPPGQLGSDIQQEIEEITAPKSSSDSSDSQVPANAEELIKMVTKDIFREWVATELPQLVKKVIRAELARIRLAKSDTEGVDK